MVLHLKLGHHSDFKLPILKLDHNYSLLPDEPNSLEPHGWGFLGLPIQRDPSHEELWKNEQKPRISDHFKGQVKQPSSALCRRKSGIIPPF
jgi:hypothetical protein